MIDDHFYPENWGVRPILFKIGNFDIQSYPFFVLLGLIVGLSVYFYESRRKKNINENGFMIVIGSLIGGTIGSKFLQWAIDYRYIISHFYNWRFFISGRTIVGGMIGGVIGVLVTKKILGTKEKRGNLFAPAVAIGVAIGRLGCFFRGCCYGKATALPWGVDFGDHVLRHPTQLYESLFMLGMFVYLEKIKNNSDIKDGQLFKILMLSYFIFRFFIEFIREEGVVFIGLTVFQIISIGAIIYLIKDNIINLILKIKSYAKR